MKISFHSHTPLRRKKKIPEASAEHRWHVFHENQIAGLSGISLLQIFTFALRIWFREQHYGFKAAKCVVYVSQNWAEYQRKEPARWILFWFWWNSEINVQTFWQSLYFLFHVIRCCGFAKLFATPKILTFNCPQGITPTIPAKVENKLNWCNWSQKMAVLAVAEWLKYWKQDDALFWRWPEVVFWRNLIVFWRVIPVMDILGLINLGGGGSKLLLILGIEDSVYVKPHHCLNASGLSSVKSTSQCRLEHQKSCPALLTCSSLKLATQDWFNGQILQV